MIWGVYTLLMSVRERTSIELPSALSGSNALMAWPGVASMRTVWANAGVASAVRRNAIWADLIRRTARDESPAPDPWDALATRTGRVGAPAASAVRMTWAAQMRRDRPPPCRHPTHAFRR